MRKKHFHLEFSKLLRIKVIYLIIKFSEWIEGDLKLLMFVMRPSFDEVIITCNVRTVHVDLPYGQIGLV